MWKKIVNSKISISKIIIIIMTMAMMVWIIIIKDNNHNSNNNKIIKGTIAITKAIVNIASRSNNSSNLD